MLERLIWQNDRMLLDDLVFRLEHFKNDDWDLGDACFVFYKTKPLVEDYARFFNSKEGFCPRNIFELGIWDGGSVVFWNELFHPQKHVAIDLKKREDSEYFRRYVRSRGLESKIKTYWGTNQADAARLRQIVAAEFQGPLDLVIDDASHMYAPTKASFETLFPLLRPGGLYVIEDWPWALRKEFQGPDHIWAKEIPLTKLIIELVQAEGSTSQLISRMSIESEFVVIERGGIGAAQLDGLKLEQRISLREQDRPIEIALVEFQRQKEELARQNAMVKKLQGELARQNAKVAKLQGELAGQQEELVRTQGEAQVVKQELAWTQEQLEQLHATRWWRVGTLYWRTHAKVKAVLGL